MTPPPADASARTHAALFDQVADHARSAGVFGAVRTEAAAVACRALNPEADAEYRLEVAEDGGFWVGFFTHDRWLSQSVEADLVHTGDKLHDLIEEEMIDLGLGRKLAPGDVVHFRDDDKRFVFRTRFDAATPAGDLAKALAAYEACFVELGDVGESEED
ncbi:MAG: hypothetical protein AAF288_09970 [Planctomycetota bacterium]